MFRYTNAVSVGSEVLGVIAQKRYVVADVQPGSQAVSATTNARAGVMGSSTLPLELVAGRAYFVRVEVPFWNIDHPTMKQVDEVEGRKAVQKCRLAQ